MEILANNDAQSLSVRVRRNRGGTLTMNYYFNKIYILLGFSLSTARFQGYQYLNSIKITPYKLK